MFESNIGEAVRNRWRDDVLTPTKLKNMLRMSVLQMEGKPLPAEWYDDPEDQMRVYLGHGPRSGAKYTVPG